MVEYGFGPSYIFEQVNENTYGKYQFQKKKKDVVDDGDDDDDDDTTQPAHEEEANFSWSCEELSFANLEREWGDIGVHEYVGQKVVVQWHRSTVDIPEHYNWNTKLSTYSTDLPVFTVKLDCAPRQREEKNFAMPLFGLRMDLVQMSARQVDDVTVSFEGNAKILECTASFEFLVGAYARSLEPLLTASQEQIMKTRPLLQHEEEYLKQVKRCASPSFHS
jgi:hypothetical protein